MEDEELTFIMFLLGIRLYDHLSRLWELTHLNVSRKLPCMYYYYPLFSVEETEAQNVQMTHLKLLSSAAGFWTQAACLLFRDLDSLQRRSPKLFQHSSGKEEGRKWLFPFYQQEHWLSDFKRFRVAGQGRVEARPSSLWVTLDSLALSLPRTLQQAHLIQWPGEPPFLDIRRNKCSFHFSSAVVRIWKEISSHWG